MNPREKAIELLNRFSATMYGDSQWLMIPSKSMQEDVKQCALIAVDEIINTGSLSEELDYGCDERNLHYWQEVKQEINQL